MLLKQVEAMGCEHGAIIHDELHVCVDGQRWWQRAATCLLELDMAYRPGNTGCWAEVLVALCL